MCVPGDIVFVDDGLISLKVTDKNASSLTTGKGSLIACVCVEGVNFLFCILTVLMIREHVQCMNDLRRDGVCYLLACVVGGC